MRQEPPCRPRGALIIGIFVTSLDGYGSAEGWPGWWGLVAGLVDRFRVVMSL